ncbi:MAG: glutathione S-transferase N-terminal domain-containing protein [Candidatus Nomurabacteria bacterium]|nr:glutathione S-transferase N-terminal domain-containing protein [Candidatus Nomurabacteria bacterium]USN87989.1 MAG: glutathione S-transferase N-terminal domain-containing protein [Candidatus Nomurabacteria bacterium]
MLTLYYKPNCSFCRRVLAVIDRLDLEVELKDVTESANLAELQEKGNSSQTPFLIDTDKEAALHESDDIVAHLQTNYGKTAATPARPRIHISDSACVSCEG